MAVLAAILPLVSRSSTLALELYRFVASKPDTARDLIKTAKSINNLALVVKQVGTIIKEDDRLPSAEAFETLEDIVDQCTAILGEVESIVPYQNEQKAQGRDDEPRDGDRRLLSSAVVARLHYLVAHLDSLKSTLTVMLQTLYTAQSIMWARVRPTVSPTQCAAAVTNEKNQLETLVIEQQISLLLALKLYEPSRPDARLLMEHDSSQSLAVVDRGPPQPSDLFKYQDKFIATLDSYNSGEEQWLPAICGVSKAQVDRLLDRWSRLRQFEENLQDAEYKAKAQRRESQQPFVESGSEDDLGSSHKFAGSYLRLSTPTPRRPGSIQPLFTETATFPIPVCNRKLGPNVPPSPASSYGVSPRSSDSSFLIPHSPSSSATSPRTSITTLPEEAAAAIDAKDKDDDLDLKIPWKLSTRRHYWRYIDGKVQDSNTETHPSEAISDRQSWTEILASWVCKEAIREAGYEFTQMQRETRDGRRTKFETCFRIEKGLTFEEVRGLVERTVEIIRKRHPPSSPLRENPRRTSFERRPVPNVMASGSTYDRDRTPLANQHQHPPLERSLTTYLPVHPPSLDRSVSMPVPIPTYPASPRSANPQVPLPTPTSPSHPTPYSPHASSYPVPHPSFPQQPLYPPHPPQLHLPLDPRLLHPNTYPQSPLRRSQARDDDYSSTSESEDEARSRRKHRSRSRRRSDTGYKRKGIEKSGATKALMGVAGLTALLDGLVGL